MLIIDNTYFKGDIYIPHAKPSITSEVDGPSEELSIFVDEYVDKCMRLTLGDVLWNEFKNELDSSQPNGLKTTADAKWDFLLNGETYLEPESGDSVVWDGIRFKIGNNYYSFLANYVYFFYQSNNYLTMTDIGVQAEDAKNATRADFTPKVVKAWNKFVELTNGINAKPDYFYKLGLLCADYSHDSKKNNLYKFIRDKNKIDDTSYKKFNPSYFNPMNELGI